MTSGWFDTTLAWISAHPVAAGGLIFLIAFCDSIIVLGILVPALPLLFAIGALIGLGHIDGPYAIALGPRCYAGLTKTTVGGYPVMEHVRRLLDGPIVWAPGVDGAVVLSQRGGDFELAVGQDFSLGYLHDVQRSYIGNYALYDVVKLQARALVARRALLGFALTAGAYRTGLALQSDGATLLGNTERRKDFRTNASIFGEYRATSWLALYGELNYLGSNTDYWYALPADRTDVVIPDPGAAYKRFDLMFGVRVHR